MTFNPDDEPCGSCGCEPEDCICGLTLDLDRELDLDLYDPEWDGYPDDDEEEGKEGELV